MILIKKMCYENDSKCVTGSREIHIEQEGVSFKMKFWYPWISAWPFKVGFFTNIAHDFFQSKSFCFYQALSIKFTTSIHNFWYWRVFFYPLIFLRITKVYYFSGFWFRESLNSKWFAITIFHIYNKWTYDLITHD